VTTIPVMMLPISHSPMASHLPVHTLVNVDPPPLQL
jgi:hypothetical protein